MMRLFVALRFSPEVDRRLEAAISALCRQGTGRFTRPENLHLTLAFLGETERIDTAKAALQTVRAPAFDLRIGQLGAFGALYWAGAVLTPELRTVQAQVERALRAADFPLERRAFRPHLTLCRDFHPRGAFDRAAVERALGRPVCRIGEISLMESTRIDGKLTYIRRAAFPLKKS